MGEDKQYIDDHGVYIYRNGRKYYIESDKELDSPKSPASVLTNPIVVAAVLGALITGICGYIIAFAPIGKDNKPIICQFQNATVQGSILCNSTIYLIATTAPPVAENTTPTATLVLIDEFRSPTPTAPTQPELSCTFHEWFDVPKTGTSQDVTVAPNEQYIWASGDVGVSSTGVDTVFFSGGKDKGNILALLPENGVSTTYSLTRLTPISNWYLVLINCSADELQRRVLIAAEGMKHLPNCRENGDSGGCTYVDIITFEGTNYTKQAYAP